MTVISDFTAVRAAHIILASASPRRVEILNTILGLEARVVPSTFPEDLDKSQFTPISYVQENARQKALEVRSRLIAAGEAPPSVVVGADTVVDQGGAILEKPKSEAQATEMLGRLSGSTHAVHTGVALLYRDGSEACFCESSEVNFATSLRGHRRVRCVRRADGQGRRVRHPGPRRRVRDRHTRLLLQRDGLPDAQILRNARRGAVGSGELRNF